MSSQLRIRCTRCDGDRDGDGDVTMTEPGGLLLGMAATARRSDDGGGGGGGGDGERR